ncbi:MFS transporter [Cellulomonas sp. JZ18]|uniref:MFS transporter n=1 Tax=Cellulomonas sp. JZ18 TaxID=2654191 RepID=UPI0012D37980|nr:MFS transporter [Cellulomonas sp. JZ18]QGQ20185.1 MFS transporter [Cellulomonas sp. JZ18]
MTGRRGPALVWTAAVLAYLAAVVHRTALGVAGVDAIERFGLSATGLASFSVVQLGVYAALQIPAGQLLDRFGARTLIAGGSLVMAVGQGLLAWADDVPTAIVARVLVGAGDAGIFISACRLVAEWFPAPRVPLLVQLTGMIGQAGQIVSAVAVALVLHGAGWGTTFGALALAGLLVTAVAWLGVRSPAPTHASVVASAVRTRFVHAVREAARPAGTRLGFWSHFLTPFSANVVAMLWGVPFFVTAQGRSPAEASALLSALTVSAMVSGPIVGRWTGRHPLRRSWSVLASAVSTLVAWVWLLVPDTPRPFWQLVLFVVVIGAGGPVSLVGIDFARTFTAADRLGTATGFVNTGGFTSSIGAILAVGVVLQLASPPGATTYTLDAYRLAFSALAVLWLVGVLGVLRNRRLARADMARAGTVVPPIRDVLRRRRA